jgi:hypothetical protein
MTNRLLRGLLTAALLAALGGCLAGESATAVGEPVATASDATTAWQCAACNGHEYVFDVSVFQGAAIGCVGEAFRCARIPWCTGVSFASCSPDGICPPGWYAGSISNGPGYCGAIATRADCTRIPYPTGTYTTCDPACTPGFSQTAITDSVSSCEFGDRRTCTR